MSVELLWCTTRVHGSGDSSHELSVLMLSSQHGDVWELRVALMMKMTHEDQSYCILKQMLFRQWFLSLRDIKIVDIKTQTKHCFFFFRGVHRRLFKTSEGFGPRLVSYIKLIYHNIYCILRINGSLTRPFPIARDIHQLPPFRVIIQYAISIEPLLSSYWTHHIIPAV